MQKTGTRYPTLKAIRIGGLAMLVLTLIQALLIHRMGWDWNTSFIDAGITTFSLAFYCFDIITIFSFYQPGKGNDFYRVLFVIAFTMLHVITVKWCLTWLLQANTSYLHFLVLSMPVRGLFAVLVFLFVVAMYWMWNSLNEKRESEQRNLDMEKLAKDAELAMLRQKLQPHFLFNSLNSISALSGSKPEQARKMIQQLSDFLRGTLKKDEQKFISLKEEFSHLNLYLEIEKVRFGHRLNIETKVDEQCNEMLLPPLLIQPIVENAIKFGLYDTLGNTTITVEVFCEKMVLIIRVENPFDQKTINANAGTGFGLSSIQRRLFLLYGRNDLLTTAKKEDRFITTLKLPQTHV